MSETSPSRTPAARRYVVARTDEIPEGERLIVTVGGREIGIYHVKGAFYALLNLCPHLGGPLCRGQVVTEITALVPGEIRGNPDKVYATCPWHNWEFDIRTGQSYWNPKGLRARPFPVDVEGGEALRRAMENGSAERVRGPYQAETIPVSIESEYVVLSLRSAPARPALEREETQAACPPPGTTMTPEETIR